MLTPDRDTDPTYQRTLQALRTGTSVTDIDLAAAFGEDWRNEIGKDPSGTAGKITQALQGAVLKILYTPLNK